MHTKDKLYLWTRGLILPLATLLPFLFTKVYQASCTIEFDRWSSVAKYTAEPGGQCIAIVKPGLLAALSIGIGIIAVVIVSLLRVQLREREAMRHFIAKQFLISLVVAAITSLAYLVVQNYSEAKGLDLVNFQSDGVITYHQKAVFGSSISTQGFLILIGVYLVTPVVRWYKVIFSRNYVAGQKKKELFQ